MKDKIKKSNVQEIFELSMVQKGMLFHYLKEINDALYNVQLCFNIEGVLAVDTFLKSIKTVQSQNEVLRSVFSWELVSKPIQIILKDCPLDFSYHDISQNTSADISIFIADYIGTDQQKRFDLTELPLRISLLKTAGSSYILCITHHHILYDGWSTGILLKELIYYYNQLRGSNEAGFVVKRSYKEIQKDIQKNIQGANDHLYWQSYLKDYEISSSFLLPHASTAGQERRIQKTGFSISKSKIDFFAKEHKVTKAAIIYAAYGLLLLRYKNTSDIIFGTTISNRDGAIRDNDNTIGNFINTIPLRLNQVESRSVIEVIKGVNDDLVERNQYANTSYSELKAMLSLKPSEHLFDSVMVIENYPLDHKLININKGFDIKLRSVYENTDVPILISVFFNEELEIEFTFKEVVNEDYIKAFSSHFNAIINKVLNNGNKEIKSLSILSENEKKQLLYDFNNSKADYPKEKTLVQLFEKQVLNSPDAVALFFNGKTLSYLELNEKANSLACEIRQRGISPNQIVALYVNRSLEMFIGLLGVLKAGAAYLPLDPSYPIDRIEYMLTDSNASILIKSEELEDPTILTKSDLTVISIHHESIAQGMDNLPGINTSEDLAYVIYTSGSTGKPKGVMVSQRAVHNYIVSMKTAFPFSMGKAIVSVTTFSFDIFVTESLLPLTQGMKIVLADDLTQKDPRLLAKLLVDQDVRIMQTTPSRYRIFVSDIENFRFGVEALEYLFIGGESLSPDLLEILKCNTHARIINVYGPTETTVWSTLIDLTEEKKLTIGIPIANTQLYVLGKQLELLPIGVIGELYIGGDGLSHGYINNQVLTDEKFIPNPFTPAKKIYKTGDLVYWNMEGKVEYVGRADFQVKIRGHRIEVGEIENQLLKHSEIDSAVVIVKRNQLNDDILCAYYTSSAELASEELRNYLSEKLPKYMIPAYFIHLLKLPFTSNSKIDRNALPDPIIKEEGNYTAPTTGDENKLLAIWCNILKINEASIGINKDFFELGGHSLKAIELVNKIYKEFGLEIALSRIFDNPTIAELSKYLSTLKFSEFQSIEQAEEKPYYRLSSSQEQLYFLFELDKDSLAYNMSLITRINGNLDKSRLSSAFQKLIMRHESLRTFFDLVDNEPVQKITEMSSFNLEYYQATDDQEEIINNFIRPFNLNKLPLMRVGLIEVADQDHILMVDIHHIITDGISVEILINEFAEYYNGEELPALKLQYKDYSEWKRLKNQGNNKAKEEAYWVKDLMHNRAVLDLPTDYPRSLVKSTEGGLVEFELGFEDSRKLNLLAARTDTTVFMILLSVYNVFLRKICNQDDVIVGVPVSGRSDADLNNTIGLFINTLPIRNYPKDHLTFEDFLSNVKAKTLACIDNQDYSYEALIDRLEIVRDTSRNPLFDTMFVFENFNSADLLISGLKFENYRRDHVVSKFDLSLLVKETSGNMLLSFEYCNKLFKEKTVKRFKEYFKTIVSSILDNEAIKIAHIQIIPEAERLKLLYEFNNTSLKYSDTDTVVSLFEKQVERTPNDIALVIGTEKMSYADLNSFANKIEKTIAGKIFNQSEIIGLLFKPGFEMIAAMLAVLKAGCIYVPLSPEVPRLRNSFILSDSNAALLLTQKDFYCENNKIDGIEDDQLIFVDKDLSLGKIIPNSSRIIPANDLIYIIYTSGTSGQPKGVEITNRGVVNYTLWRISHHNFNSKDIALQLLSYHFDGFAAVLYSSLLSGSKLILISEEEKSRPDLIVEIIKNEGVTNFAITPSLYSPILDHLQVGEELSHLKLVVLAGEKTNTAVIKKSQNSLPKVLLENEYGPTETTIGATHGKTLNEQNNAIIGTPIANTSIYILNPNNELVPIGIPGEICISGDGVAKGYVNNQILTNERFLNNPFIAGERMYKTGDLGRWLPEGEIELLGRLDGQVKIRGVRIELGEIEAQLLTHCDVKDASVIAGLENDAEFLVAYYVSETAIETLDLRGFLSDRLPISMIPGYFIHLNKLPQTPSGKLDIKALPIPEMELDIQYVAPQTQEQLILEEVWSAVLGIKNISITDNFFAIGGDSIKSIQISARMRNLGYDVSVKEIFMSQNIKELSFRLRKIDVVSDQALIKGIGTLTPIQKWFFQGSIVNKNHFNQSVLLNFAEGITEGEVKIIFEKLIEHHDAFRMVFNEKGDDINFEIREYSLPVSFVVHDLKHKELSGEKISMLYKKVQSEINIKNGPLMNIALFETQAGTQLLIVIHHLIIDTISWRILFEDIETLHQQIKGGTALYLPLKTDSYLFWSKQLSSYIQSKAFQDAKKYWNSTLAKEISQIPLDYPLGKNRVENAKTITCSLNEDETRRLLTLANKPFNTGVQDLLLTALLLSIHKQFGLTSVKVDIEGHGREDVLESTISRTVGWFTTIFPVILESKSEPLSQAIKHVKELLRTVPNSGFDYLIWKYLEDGGINRNSLSSKPAQISFNYLGQFDTDTQGKLFTIVEELKTENIGLSEVREYNWEILSMVTQGELVLNFMYSEAQYESETINALLLLIKENLIKIINYCSTYKKEQITPSDLTYKYLSIIEVDELQQKYNFEDIYQLSPMQEGMLFHALLDSHSDNYFGQLTFKLSAQLDLVTLEKSMNDILSRYAILRSIFLKDGYQQTLQVVLKERKIDFSYIDVESECLSSSIEEVTQLYQKKDRARKFNLAQDVLMRVTVLKISISEFLIIWSHHHIIMDGWCMGIIINDFKKIYSINKNNRQISLQPVMKYSNYIKWLQSKDKKQSLDYWKGYLSTYENLAVLPKKEVSSSGIPVFNLKTQMHLLNKEQTRLLHKVSRENAVTLSTILQCAWAILLTKYNNVDDVVFGAVVSGRPVEIKGIETMVGLFVNTIPVRLTCKPDDTVFNLLTQLQANSIESEPHHYCSLSEIQSVSNLKRGLFDHILEFDNFPVAEGIKEKNVATTQDINTEDFEVTDVNVFEQSNYGFSLIMTPGEEIQMRIDYDSNIYDDQKVMGILVHLQRIIEQITLNVQLALSKIQLLSEEERNTVLYKFNPIKNALKSSHTYVEIFQEQVAKTPGSIAVISDEGVEISYKCLNESANKVARYLDENLSNGACVPVLMESSADLLINMLGILKAGMVYVPLNIDVPILKTVRSISELNAKILITKRSVIDKIDSFYDKLTEQTAVEKIIFYDQTTNSSIDELLFKTFKLSASLIRGDDQHLQMPVLFDGSQKIEMHMLNQRVAQLAKLIGEKCNINAKCAVVLSNPLLKILAIHALRHLRLPFQLFSDQSILGEELLEDVSCILTEHSFNVVTDNLFWEKGTLKTLILLDNYKESKKEESFKKVWNHIAENTTDAINDYGWTSSYTGLSFSISEMEEYVHNFKLKLAPYLTSDTRILEIGCGHGLLLFELAPAVCYYHATDLSEKILEKNKQRLESMSISNVNLQVLAASEIKNVYEQNYDVIVCSSVVHYFPDTIYLEKVIADSIALIEDEGIIYFDDLLNLAEKANLIESTKKYKEANPGSKVKTDWAYDLFVGSEFFEFVQEKYPSIVKVEVSKKTGIIENELTKYRYDVLLKVDKKISVDRKIGPLRKARYNYLESINRKELADPSAVYFKQPGSVMVDTADIITVQDIELYDAHNLPQKNAFNDLSYIIYTSGTTGTPKGAMIHHGGMLNHLYAKINDLQMLEDDIVAQTAPATFDISIWQFLAALISGGRVHIISKDTLLEPRLLIKELQRGKITIFESVPSLITTFLDGLPPGKDNVLKELRWMIPTGEALTVALVRKWYSYFPNIKLLNAYGPTEASDDVTHHIVEPTEDNEVIVPIGKPVQNTHIYILDKHLNLCPVGVMGEICVAGLGVGKGYWGDEHKTNKVFIPNPISNFEKDGYYNTVYKTGDMGYYLENGVIVCAGRIDNQVKIRGFRIELEEIEYQLTIYHKFQDVVVIAREIKEEPTLIAYYVSENDVDVTDLKRHLSNFLVDYMIPAFFVRLQAMPVTLNGKLDRQALPHPEHRFEGDFVAPSNSVEEKMLDIWSDILNIERGYISTTASFFELGGHSLKATMLINKIHKVFDVEVPLKEVFNKQDIKNLADYLITVGQLEIQADNISDNIEITI